MKKFQFIFECEDTLTEDAIWPDGDGPKNPTLDDVVKHLKKGYTRNPVGLLSDWNFGECITLTVIDPDTKKFAHNVLE